MRLHSGASLWSVIAQRPRPFTHKRHTPLSANEGYGSIKICVLACIILWQARPRGMRVLRSPLSTGKASRHGLRASSTAAQGKRHRTGTQRQRNPKQQTLAATFGASLGTSDHTNYTKTEENERFTDFRGAGCCALPPRAWGRARGSDVRRICHYTV